MKVCLVASSGGHLEELSRIKSALNKHDCFLVTEKCEGFSSMIQCETLFVDQMNRKEAGFVFKFIKLFLRANRIMKARRPDLVITTGALIAFPFCIIAKALKAKVVYIESLARIDSLSLTGRLVYPISDLFLVQWESLVDQYEKAIYVGSLV